mgnify:CR=1 FL=1
MPYKHGVITKIISAIKTGNVCRSTSGNKKSSFNCCCLKVANLQRIERKQGVKLNPRNHPHSPSCAKRPVRRRYPRDHRAACASGPYPLPSRG